MKKIYYFFTLIIFVSFPGLAQEDYKCGTETYLQNLQQKYPNLQKGRQRLEEMLSHKNLRMEAGPEAIFRIPVVVHIIHKNEAVNLSDERVLSQIQVINEDYRRENPDTINAYPPYMALGADTKIEFCLANRDPEGNPTNGIVRKPTNVDVFDGYQNENADIMLKSISYWPSDQYLNIWVTDLGHYDNGILRNVLGYSSFPSGSPFNDFGGNMMEERRDGIVIDYLAFGKYSAPTYKYNLGRTVTHEIGHWLGLLHIWGDSFCGNDGIGDTPIQNFHNKSMTKECNPKESTCNGITVRDMHENYMDYSPDVCMNLFTMGQKERMRLVVENSPRRRALLSSKGCCSSPFTYFLPFTESFETDEFYSNGWSVKSDSVSGTWTVTSLAGYGETDRSMVINNNASNTGSKDTLITPSLNFTDFKMTSLNNLNQIQDAFLEFKVAYARSSTMNATDSLIVYYNYNCKDEIPLIALAGDQLVSTSRQISNFIPTKEEWKDFKVNLSPLIGKGAVNLSFVNTSKGQNNLYLDDINVYKTLDQLQVVLYPNPANDYFNFVATFKDTKSINWALYNSIGEKLIESTESDVTSFKKIINTRHFFPGVYILVATADGQKVVQRIMVEQF